MVAKLSDRITGLPYEAIEAGDPVSLLENDVPYAKESQLVNDNLLINGGFDFWQRGGSFQQQGFCADRWFFNLSGATGSANLRESLTQEGIGQGSDIVSPNHIRVENFTADNNVGVITRLENVRTLSGKKATVSFRATEGVANYKVSLFQNFGVGGSPLVRSTYQIPSGEKWERLSVTFNVPSIAGKTVGTDSHIGLEILNPENEIMIFRLADIKLEEGDVATPYQARPIAEELALCKRYYESGFANILLCSFYASTAWGSNTVPFGTPKRTTPAMTSVINNTYNLGNPTEISGYRQGINYFQPTGLGTQNSSTTGADDGWISFTWTADAEIYE